MAKFLVEIRVSGESNRTFSEYVKVVSSDHDKAACIARLEFIDRAWNLPKLRARVSAFATPASLDEGLKLVYVHRCTQLA